METPRGTNTPFFGGNPPKNHLVSLMSFKNYMFLQNLKSTFSRLQQLFIFHFIPKLSDKILIWVPVGIAKTESTRHLRNSCF